MADNPIPDFTHSFARRPFVYRSYVPRPRPYVPYVTRPLLPSSLRPIHNYSQFEDSTANDEKLAEGGDNRELAADANFEEVSAGGNFRPASTRGGVQELVADGEGKKWAADLEVEEWAADGEVDELAADDEVEELAANGGLGQTTIDNNLELVTADEPPAQPAAQSSDVMDTSSDDESEDDSATDFEETPPIRDPSPLPLRPNRQELIDSFEDLEDAKSRVMTSLQKSLRLEDQLEGILRQEKRDHEKEMENLCRRLAQLRSNKKKRKASVHDARGSTSSGRRLLLIDDILLQPDMQGGH